MIVLRFFETRLNDEIIDALIWDSNWMTKVCGHVDDDRIIEKKTHKGTSMMITSRS